MAGRSLVIPEASKVDVARVADLARQIESWADTTEDRDALEDARAKVAAIETYLRRKHEGAAAEIARAARKLDFRVARLLPPASETNGRKPSDLSHASERYDAKRAQNAVGSAGIPRKDSFGGIPKDDRYRLRKMDAHRDEPAVVEAVERGASQREVLRAIDKVKAGKVVDDAKTWFNDNIPAPTDPEGDKFRARVWDSILAVERAAEAMNKWTVDDVRRAITTEKHKHVRKQMVDGLVGSIAALDPYREAVP